MVSRTVVNAKTKLSKANNIINIYRELQKIAKSLHSLDEADCNYGLTPRQEKREENLVYKAEELASEIGLKAFHQSDPRGCSLYLVDPKNKEYYMNYNTQGIAIY